MATKQPYFVLKQESRFSKIQGTPMVKITFLGIKDRSEYVTYVDSANRNHSQWQHLTSRPDHGFIVSNLNIKKYKGRELINADSQFVIEWEDQDDQDMLKQIAEIWAEDDRRNDTDKFRDLFPSL